MCLDAYGLDLVQYCRVSGLSWDTMLKHTELQFEPTRGPDILLMLERGTQRGVSIVSMRYVKANNSYMKMDCNESEPQNFIHT